MLNELQYSILPILSMLVDKGSAPLTTVLVVYCLKERTGDSG